MKMEGGMLMGDSCNNNDSEQGRGEIHNKAGRYANRKRLQVQRMKSFGLDAEEGIGEIFKKKGKVEEESSTPVGFLVAMETKVEDVEVDLRNYPSVSNGFFSMCGRRRAMEDAVTISPGLLSLGDEPVFDFFGVYDGHGGSEVAYLCRDMMHGLLVKEVDGLDVGGDGFDWKRAMEGCFLKMDAEVDERGSEVADIKSIGSTAVVALVGMEKVIVANCGDSRAVLSRSGQAVPLSVDHKADRPDEMERVETAGGRVIDWNGYRVLGVLATSRSIGDDYLKPYVISEPEVVVMDRTDDDEFIILASDGLWDVMTNVLACDVVRRCFNGQLGRRFAGAVVGGSAAAQAAAILAELAMARGSRDNISVVVIELKGWKKQR